MRAGGRRELTRGLFVCTFSCESACDALWLTRARAVAAPHAPAPRPRYLLNVQFNILNKQIYNFFPFPWCVRSMSAPRSVPRRRVRRRDSSQPSSSRPPHARRFVSCVHLIVGLAVMSVFWVTKVVPFQKPDEQFIKDVSLPAFLHAFGHCLTNVSFAAVAVSFTHTVKTLEPVFSAAGSYLVSGTVYPLPVYLALLPIMAGVALASATELSFTWLGFSTAMASNIAFAGRAIYSKNLMKRMTAVNLYNYVTIVALLFCIPPTLYFEGAGLAAGLKAAAAKVGTQKLLTMLFNVGLYYHLYNQVAYQALEKVEPITHAVGNVGKRIFVIGFSIVAFGNAITTQTAIGSIVAILGAGLYSYLKATMTESKH